MIMIMIIYKIEETNYYTVRNPSIWLVIMIILWVPNVIVS